jgi:SAM-dependent methyltransferase
MNFEGAFDAVLSWGTTFGYFDDDVNKTVLDRMHRALKPGGLLLLDVVNRDYVIRGQPNNVWFEGDGCVVMEETQVNYISSRLHVKRTVMLDDGRQRESAYSVRLYSLHELGQMLHKSFRVVEVSGREATPGVFFGADSPRLLVVAERRLQAVPAAPPAAPPAPPKKSLAGPTAEKAEKAEKADKPEGEPPQGEGG